METAKRNIIVFHSGKLPETIVDLLRKIRKLSDINVVTVKIEGEAKAFIDSSFYTIGEAKIILEQIVKRCSP